MNDIKTRFIDFFKKISSIPHPSGETGNLKRFISEFAKSSHLEVIEDQNNLIIKMPASPDCRDLKPVIIQGHLDMVALADSDKKHDFKTDKLDIILSEDKLYADRTSLGGDDGVAICYMLMLMQETDLSHPPLYFVLTADEEIGCLGAKALNFTTIKDAAYMINLDTEFEGYSPNASAAGETLTILSKYQKQVNLGTLWQIAVLFPGDSHPVASVTRSSLQPLQVLTQALLEVFLNTNSFLINLESSNKPGTLSNHCQALFLTTSDDEIVIAKLKSAVFSIMGAFSKEDITPIFTLPISLGIQKYETFSKKDSVQILRNEAFLPTGVLLRDENNPIASIALVNCSVGDGVFENTFQLRGRDSAIVEFLRRRVQGYFNTPNTYASFNVDALAWKAKNDSEFFKRANRIWKERENSDLMTGYCHGFLETGIFQNALPELDIISFGPTVCNIHSTKETIDLNSVQKVYLFLKELLEDFKPREENIPAVIERSDGTIESIQSFYKNKPPLEPADCDNCPEDCFNED